MTQVLVMIVHMRRWAVFVLFCFFICAAVRGQTGQDMPAAQGQAEPKKMILRGCLGNDTGDFRLASATAEGILSLSGNTSGLEKYTGRELILEGSVGEKTRVAGLFEPFATFYVNRIIEVVEKAEPKLDRSFQERVNWQGETDRKYGVTFSHPKEMKPVPAAERQISSNFATQEGAEAVNTFDIPGMTYANANLVGGSFAIFVNRQITNRASCLQFGQLGPREEAPTPYKIGQLRYMKAEGGGVAGGGRWEADYYFHTFQGGLCYELAIALMEFNPQIADTGCNIPLLSEEDNLRLITLLVSSVAFFRPAIRPYTVADLRVVPEVTEFVASSDTADDAANRGAIRFSWATRNADYVEFTYTCEDPEEAEDDGVSSVVISENGPNRYCQNIPSFERFGGGHFYRSPQGSADMGFGYFDHEDPTSVVVTLTPFAHGIAFPASSKSLTVTIHPYNPFQRGVPTDTRNMSIWYEPDSGSENNYAQGSQVEIHWTDEREQDPCVNLYLVQDNSAGGANFILQLNLGRNTGCLKPARRGSYIWTITTKYVGSGFRILAGTPGGFSGTLGPTFNIVRPATGLPR